MALFKGTGERQAEALEQTAEGNIPTDAEIVHAGEEAVTAASRGDDYFVWQLVSMGEPVGPRRVARALNEIAGSGWQLVGQSAMHSTIALNRDVLIFTFERRR